MGITDIEPVCGGTLVVHLDGSHDCEHDVRCGADRLLHDHVVGCDDTALSIVGIFGQGAPRLSDTNQTSLSVV